MAAEYSCTKCMTPFTEPDAMHDGLCARCLWNTRATKKDARLDDLRVQAAIAIAGGFYSRDIGGVTEGTIQQAIAGCAETLVAEMDRRWKL